MTNNLAAITPAWLRERPLPAPGDSKNTRGTALVIGGSIATPGAVILAGLAALRVGAGVLTVAVPAPVAIPLAVAVPEAGVSSWDDGATPDAVDLSGPVSKMDKASSVLVGPGFDDSELASRMVAETLDALSPDVPLVLDAFALGVLPALGDRVTASDRRVVLTPNHAEAARLLGMNVDAVQAGDDEQIATEVARRWRATVIYQGIVATADSAVTVGTGHGGLGTSGSGDVLAGAVAGLLARGAELDQAAGWAAYLHAAAADRLAAHVGKVGFLARELLGELPRVMSEVDT